MNVSKKTITRIDLAYICFTLWLLLAWIEPIGKLLPITPDAGQLILDLFILPSMFIALIAIPAAIILSIMEWREWPLPIMAGLLIFMTYVFLAIDVRGTGTGGGYVNPMWYILGSAVLLAFCIRWFVFKRRHDSRQPQ